MRSVLFTLLFLFCAASAPAAEHADDAQGSGAKPVQQNQNKPPTESKKKDESYKKFTPSKRIDADTAIALPADI